METGALSSALSTKMAPKTSLPGHSRGPIRQRNALPQRPPVGSSADSASTREDTPLETPWDDVPNMPSPAGAVDQRYLRDPY